MIKHKQLEDFFSVNSNVLIVKNPTPLPGAEFIFGYTISQQERDDIYNQILACENCVDQAMIDTAKAGVISDLAKIAS